MAILNITNEKGEGTVTPPPSNSFQISTLVGSKCDPVIYRNVDTVAYFDNSGDEGPRQRSTPTVGDTIYADEAMTTLYVTSFSSFAMQEDFSINNKSFITIGEGSIVINTSCK